MVRPQAVGERGGAVAQTVAPSVRPPRRPGCCGGKSPMGSPPGRDRKARALSRSPRPRRAAKYLSAVWIAVSFSAAAVTRNWFILVPSASASFSIAAFSETSKRSEKVDTVVVIFLTLLVNR